MPHDRRSSRRITAYRAEGPGVEERWEVQCESVSDALHFAWRDLREGLRTPLEIVEDGVVVYDAETIARVPGERRGLMPPPDRPASSGPFGREVNDVSVGHDHGRRCPPAARQSFPQPQPIMHEVDPSEMYLDRPDPSFHLGAAVRAQLHPVLNADVLERLLAWSHPEYRAEVLEDVVALSRQLGKARNVSISVGSVEPKAKYPEINALLRELVWTPGTGRELQGDSPEQ